MAVNYSESWKNLPWKQLQKNLFRLQCRVWKAIRAGERNQAINLQKLIVKSRSARLLAIRQVTLLNLGKKTAGVDGVKSLTPIARIKLAKQLRIKGKSKATRRVWIPKPGKDEKRPLGIPTV